MYHRWECLIGSTRDGQNGLCESKIGPSKLSLQVPVKDPTPGPMASLSLLRFLNLFTQNMPLMFS